MIFRYFVLTLILASYFTPRAVQAQLSDVEKTMVTYIEAHHGEAVALLKKTVNINSGSMNFEGVREVGRVFQKELDALGFATRWVEGEKFHRAGHLMAERTGTGKRLLLIGHLDTVFETDSPFQHFEMLNDFTASGPGVADMKGGDVIILQALKALQAAGELEEMSIIVALIGDEEDSGHPLKLSRQALTDAADAADIALGFENGDGNPATAVIARRGYTNWQLNVKGKPAHSSIIFRQGIGAGAIYETSRILNGFYQGMVGEQYLTFNPGMILGGTSVDHDASQTRGTAFGKSNVIAEHAVVTGDLRTISSEQLERAKKNMQAVVAKHLPRTSAELMFEDGYPPLSPSEGNLRLLKLFDEVSQDLGQGAVTAVDPGSAGAADVSFTAGRVEMAIDGLGLGGDGEHTVNEIAHLKTLPMQAKRTAVLMYRLTRSK